MKTFAWIHLDISNRSVRNMAQNITEYVTVELLSRGHKVVYVENEEQAKAYDMYAVIGTMYSDALYNDNVQNVNNSTHVMVTPSTLLDKLSYINLMLNPQKHFVGNTENLHDTCHRTDKIYDVCVCTSGGVTALKLHNYINLSDDATIIVADYSNVSLQMSKHIIDEWDMVEDFNEFVDRHKLISNSHLYMGRYDYSDNLKKASNYKFTYVDLFDVDSVKQCLSLHQGKTGLWLASNIFNFITTSLLYDVEIRHTKQHNFIEVLANDSTDWDVGINTTASGIYKNANAKLLRDIKIDNNLSILPWVTYCLR